MRTTSGTFELSLSAGGVDDEMVTFEVQVEAKITEAEYAEITDVYYIEQSQKINAAPTPWKASWLLNIIPQPVLDAWAVTLYESASHITDDRADWERDQRRDQEATKQRFAALTGAGS